MFCFKQRVNKKAFTLTELLIALGVIGVLTAILMPIIFHLKPDQNIIMAKRAFYTTETIVSELLNDGNCYPKMRQRVGFDDGKGYSKCKKWGGEDNPGVLDAEENPSLKLVTLFADYLDIRGDINSETNKYSFTTKDGMIWTFSNFKFQQNEPKSYALLTIDVNGTKEPNCGQSATAGACVDKARNNRFDKFTMIIYARGKVQILDCWATLAARVDKKLVGDNEPVTCEDLDLPDINENCETAPTSPDDFCCNDPAWKDLNACNTCISRPTSPDDYCCSPESESSWIGSQACDPCTYKTVSDYNDECCSEGTKWHDKKECKICGGNYPIDCCLSKKDSITAGDECCEYDAVKAEVPACNN